MIPPSRTPVWSPVESLDQLEVIVVERDGRVLVELVDTRTWTVLVSLTPDEAAQFACRLVAKAQGPAVERVRADAGGLGGLCR
ncbi:MAG TPA: hypothetical protein VGW74_11520 [Propionibacteriaceae bacterium]|nr:hypothetical protein [Propionibacteriaceae bacterium]